MGGENDNGVEFEMWLPQVAASDVAAGTDAKLAQLKQDEGAAERKVQLERSCTQTRQRCSRRDEQPGKIRAAARETSSQRDKGQHPERRGATTETKV